ncbi:MAG: serine--tRNA ligase, partial [bacterium]|nr:serine--tRNA ligase [bacterium]
MRFFLKGRLKLNRCAKEAMDDLEAFFIKANSELLARGAPPGEGARVVSWSLADDVIYVEIASEGPIRAHDALLRVKNGIGKELGKKHRMGVRKSSVDVYEIAF